MSGIAGIVLFDGRPVEHGQVEAMTSAMRRRGPDGLSHWRKGSVALGQCMLRTTPESLDEIQPLGNEDESLILVMDGRVDNADDLRRELTGKGAVLRTLCDAELVLRAYEVWGEDCPRHVIGECVFFVWDDRRQRLFGARDAAGTRHFYYYQGKAGFAFASEIKGLLALPQIGRRLNESRLLDYLVEEFDRDDEVGTFYQGIARLPAGHAMSVTPAGPRTWRWWNPGELPAQKFASLNECTEAFMEQLRLAVKCRLRSIKPLGAMLSGGLDSSSIVGLISKEFRGELREPLRTVSLIRDDRENCPDWRSIDEILKADPWLQPRIVTSAWADRLGQKHLDSIAQADEPFGVFNGLTYSLTYSAAREAGCGVVLDGMAGDVLFYSLSQTATLVARAGDMRKGRALSQAYRGHGQPGAWADMLRALPGGIAPRFVRAAVQSFRDERALRTGDLALLRPGVARTYLAAKRAAAARAGRLERPQSDQQSHARNFTGGLISFAHEVYGPLALSQGVEPRSPFSDRRLIEFALRMPLQAKLAIPRYKHLLRAGTVGMLPDAVRTRADIGGHPGWTFFERLARCMPQNESGAGAASQRVKTLDPWVDPGKSHNPGSGDAGADAYDQKLVALRSFIVSQWLQSRDLC